MVFIRPTILRNSVQAAFETNAKYSYIRDIQLRQGEENVQLMRDAERPILPELPEAQPTGQESPAEPDAAE